jgi:hypothetical protein
VQVGLDNPLFKPGHIQVVGLPTVGKDGLDGEGVPKRHFGLLDQPTDVAVEPAAYVVAAVPHLPLIFKVAEQVAS